MNQDGIAKSNYLVEVTPETCKACGLCMKRCPKDAIELKFSTKATNKFRKAVVVDSDLCVGCGVCVHKCKPKSIILKLKEGRNPAPETTMELMTQIGLSSLQGKGTPLTQENITGLMKKTGVTAPEKKE